LCLNQSNGFSKKIPPHNIKPMLVPLHFSTPHFCFLTPKLILTRASHPTAKLWTPRAQNPLSPIPPPLPGAGVVVGNPMRGQTNKQTNEDPNARLSSHPQTPKGFRHYIMKKLLDLNSDTYFPSPLAPSFFSFLYLSRYISPAKAHIVV